MKKAKGMLSIGVLGCNAEAVVASALESLRGQSIFQHLEELGLHCELLYLAHGCSDTTWEIAQEMMEQEQGGDLAGVSFQRRAYNFPRLSKTETWNRFVHELTDKASQLLFVIDSDVILLDQDALFDMYKALTYSKLSTAKIDIVTGRISVEFPVQKPGRLKKKNLSQSPLDGGYSGSQLYCMRSSAARRIWIPKDLPCCEYQFIRRAITSNMFTGPELHNKVTVTPGTCNIFNTNLSICQSIRFRKQQIIGQTIIHLLINNYINALPVAQRLDLKTLLEFNDRTQPGWLKVLIFEHINRTRYFWQIYPGILRDSIDISAFSPSRHCGLRSFLSSILSITIACFAAARFLKRGHVHYWPDDPTTDCAESVAGNSGSRTRPSLPAQSAHSLARDVSQTSGD